MNDFVISMILLGFIRIIIPIVVLVLFIVLTKKLYKTFRKSIKNIIVSKLLALFVADLIANIASLIGNSIYFSINGGSLIFASLSFSNFPLLGRVYSLRYLANNFESLGFWFENLISDIDYYYGYALVESTVIDLVLLLGVIISIFVTIFEIVFIIKFLVKKTKDDKEAEKVFNEESFQQNVSAQGSTVRKPKTNNKFNDEFIIEELKKYKKLLDDNVLTQEEFDAKKKQLLGF